MLHDLIVSLYGETTYRVLAFIFRLYSLWLPPLLMYAFWKAWVRYVRYLFFVSTPTVLLEIKLPKEITKSPLAMEIVLNAFYQLGGEGTVIDKYWSGKTRDWFSLELVSQNSEVKFYIWTRNRTRNIIEAHIYSQYSEIDIREVEDYAKEIKYDSNKYQMWATNYKLTAPKPFPLRTYIDYGLDKNPKPENENDPLATVLEVLSNIKPQERIWLQFVIRGHKNEKRKGFLSKEENWSSQIDKLRGYFLAGAGAERRGVLSAEEGKILDALHRAIQKSAFDTGIRALYIADYGHYNNTTVTSLRGLFRAFSANFPVKELKAPEKIPDKPDALKPNKFYAAFNGLAISSSTDTDYPWEDYKNVRMDYQKRKKLDAYKRRMFFYAPYREKDDEQLILTTEALATLYHFPTSSVKTPGLDRIESKRSQAPNNLPI